MTALPSRSPPRSMLAPQGSYMTSPMMSPLFCYISVQIHALFSTIPVNLFPRLALTHHHHHHSSTMAYKVCFCILLNLRSVKLTFTLRLGWRQGRVPPHWRRQRQRLAQHRCNHQYRRGGWCKLPHFFPIEVVFTYAFQENKYTIKNDNTGKETTYQVCSRAFLQI